MFHKYSVLLLTNRQKYHIIVSNDTLFRGEMEINYQLLDNIFLFDGLCEEDKKRIADNLSPRVREYHRGELIFSGESAEKCVGFVLSGECEVRRTREDDFVILNTLTNGSSFGILSVFAADDEFPTSIFARKNAAVLFFSDFEIKSLVEEYPKIALNVIGFLSKRIIFLNKKIATYSGGSVNEKLSSYLYTKYLSEGDEFPLNCKRCSEALGVGRASVYRALDALASGGIITFNDKKIKINDPSGLERN